MFLMHKHIGQFIFIILQKQIENTCNLISTE